MNVNYTVVVMISTHTNIESLCCILKSNMPITSQLKKKNENLDIVIIFSNFY